MKIINKHKEPDAEGIYVGRPSPFGNPFELSSECTRDQACDQFHDWIRHPDQSSLRSKIRDELYGKNLICWCAPKRCHAETLRAIALSVSDDALFRPAPTSLGF